MWQQGPAWPVAHRLMLDGIQRRARTPESLLVTRAGRQALWRLPLWPPHLILSGPLYRGRVHHLGLREEGAE